MGQAATPATVRGTDGRVYAFGYKGVKLLEVPPVRTMGEYIQSVQPDSGWLYELRMGDYERTTYVHIALGSGVWVEVEPKSFSVDGKQPEALIQLDHGEYGKPSAIRQVVLPDPMPTSYFTPQAKTFPAYSPAYPSDQPCLAASGVGSFLSGPRYNPGAEDPGSGC